MANTPDYALVRVDNNIPNNSVLKYDAVNDMLKSTGLVAVIDGELQAAAGSVNVGLQSMESSGEQVTFTNMNSLVTYAPPWHVVDEQNPGGSMDRFYGPIQNVVRFDKREVVVTDPVMNVRIPTDTLALSFNFTWPEAQPGVVFEWFGSIDKPAIWRQVHDVSQGVQDEVWKTPLAYHAGNYVFKIYRLDGQPLKVMGDAITGYAGYSVKYREFSEKQLATQEYVQNAVKTGGMGVATGDMLKSVYDKTDKGIVDRATLADNLTGYSNAPHSTYYGVGPDGTAGFYPLPTSSDVAGLGKEVKDIQDRLGIAEPQIKLNKDELARHETAINGHGVQLASQANNISANANNIKLAQQGQQQVLNELLTVRNSAATGLVVDRDTAAKTLTIKMTSSSGAIIDTALVDLSSWFATTPKPVTDYKIYYGFVSNPPLDEASILRLGTAKTVPSIAGLDVNLTRSSTTQQFMWIWIPDGAGVVRGFTFGGFMSVWGSVAVSVAGTQGKFFISPQQTSATDVTFEVTV